MQKPKAVDKVTTRFDQLSPKQFEHLCKLVIEEIEAPDNIDVTEYRKDGGIDVIGYVGNRLYRGKFGVQVKNVSGKVGQPDIRKFHGSLDGRDCVFGLFITKSSFTEDAEDWVDDNASHPIELFNGQDFARAMIDKRVGIMERVDGRLEINNDFWEQFDKFENDLLSSIKVPQANKIERIADTVDAVSGDNTRPPEIAEYFERVTEDDWRSRQGHYYATATELLGFIRQVGHDNETPDPERNYRVTERGKEFLNKYNEGEETPPVLRQGVKRVDIVEDLINVLNDEGRLTHKQLKHIMRDNTEITGDTVDRRASTIKTWVSWLSEVSVLDNKNPTVYEFYPKTLTDDWG